MVKRQSRRTLAAAMALSVAAAALAGAALAQTAAEKAVAARQANFKQLGASFKTINDELKKDAPDMAAIGAAATKMRDLAVGLPSWFPKGSGAESGAKTRAKAEIWTDAAGFAVVQRGLQTQTAQLQKLAAAGDLAGVRGQVKPTGGACAACHDKYRTPQP